MICDSCGAEIANDSRFCPTCGKQQAQPAQQVCGNCGQKISDGQVFCTACGTKAASAGAGAPSPPPAQFRPPVQTGQAALLESRAATIPGTGAGVGKRAVATIVDCVIFFFISYFLAAMSGSATSGGFELTGGPFFLMCVIGFVYYLIFEGTKGATPGKMLVGLKVVKTDGSRCDFGAAAIRTVLRLVDGFLFYLIGAIVVWSSKTKQRLGDRVANTLVVEGGMVKFNQVGDYNNYNFDE
ncbi:RDD family protein [Pelotomaculum isophthalicicum JI]|uniref:RDD family protein n=1 Tax=Pelotomaculum isophthalicicum JI TaxID=947010 RepID=A0A9X4GYK7_9FIRM|nr:RDD family protein [Pelotomaculum isophthalicicum]MDF9407882.1 RDD family protein [Pelotomaculum isophthalicicum JI]